MTDSNSLSRIHLPGPTLRKSLELLGKAGPAVQAEPVGDQEAVAEEAEEGAGIIGVVPEEVAVSCRWAISEEVAVSIWCFAKLMEAVDGCRATCG